MQTLLEQPARSELFFGSNSLQRGRFNGTGEVSNPNGFQKRYMHVRNQMLAGVCKNVHVGVLSLFRQSVGVM